MFPVVVSGLQRTLASVQLHVAFCHPSISSIVGTRTQDRRERLFGDSQKGKDTKLQIKGVLDNAGRGSIFMMIFFIRELIDHEVNE